jgi:PrtD family type I secretion system ABC transporter
MANSESSRIRQILSAFRGAFAAAALFSVFINLLMLTIPLYLINVFTHVFSSMSLETLGLLTLVAGGALLLQSALELVRGRLLVRVSSRLDARLGREVLAATLASAAGTNRHSAQPLRDVNELRNLLQGGDVFRLIDIPIIPVFVAVLYLFHPTLAAIAGGGALVLFGLALLNEWVSRGPYSKFNEMSMKSINQADDYVRNADVIRAMGMMPAITAAWHAESSAKYEVLHAGADWGNRLRAAAKFIRMMLQISMLGAGTYLFLQHEIMPGTIIAASILMGRALAPVEAAIGTWKNVVSARAAYKRLETLLDLVEARSKPKTGLPVPQGRLAVERVTVAVPDTNRLLLKQVGFELPPGELLGIVGPSGAGKSTLGRVLVGVISPNTGAVRLDGASLQDWDADVLGRYLGYLPQDVQLFTGSVADNIARMDAAATPEAIVEAAQRVGVHEMILRLPNGYDTQIGEGGLALSAGQKQQIGIARAYFGTPALVVLDEPNANLDGESELALRAALEENKARGVTQVVISHRPGLLQAADKILLVRDGVMESFGSTAEILGRVLPSKEVAKIPRAAGAEAAAGPKLPRFQRWSGQQ